jgi:hypothetical protein
MGGPEPTPTPGRSLRQAAYLTAGMGIVHAVLLLLSFWILRSMPGPGAAEATLQAFYGGADRRRVLAVGLYLLPFAAIAFVWFIVALRMWIGSHGRPEQALFSNIQLVSGILFIALLLEAAAAYSIDAAVVEFSNGSLSPALARQFPQLGRVLGLVLAMRLAAMFVIATSSIGRHTAVLPAWFIWLGYVVGAFLLLAATLSAVLILVFPIWVLTLCPPPGARAPPPARRHTTPRRDLACPIPGMERHRGPARLRRTGDQAPDPGGGPERPRRLPRHHLRPPGRGRRDDPQRPPGTAPGDGVDPGPADPCWGRCAAPAAGTR